MKRQYTRPTLRIERFSLSQTVASSCGDFTGSTLGKPSSGDKVSCGWDVGGYIVWVADSQSAHDCNVHMSEDARFEAVCYNNPNGGLTIFGS